MKKILFVFFLFSLVLCGCQNKEVVQTPHDDTKDSLLVEARDYWIYHQDNGEFMVVEKLSGKCYPLLNNPLVPREIRQSVGQCKVFENKVYYILVNAQGIRTIECIDLDTGVRQTIYEEPSQSTEIVAFGVKIWEPPVSFRQIIPNTLSNFVFSEGNLILLRNEAISLLERGRESVLYEGSYRQFTCDGSRLFLEDAEGVLCQVEGNTGKLHRFEHIYPAQLTSYDGQLFFFDKGSGDGIYTLDFSTGQKKLLVPGSWKVFRVNGGRILAQDSKGALMLYDLEGKFTKELEHNQEYVDFYLTNDGSTVVFTIRQPNGKFSYSPICL